MSEQFGIDNYIESNTNVSKTGKEKVNGTFGSHSWINRLRWIKRNIEKIIRWKNLKNKDEHG